MSCARYHELISRYADNEVTARQRQELLHHVEHCHDCAAWLARVRQAEVLLKGVPDTRPSDRVKSAVLQTVREQRIPGREDGRPRSGVHRNRHFGMHFGGLGLGFLLRFDPSPGRIAMVAVACIVAMTGLAYQLNLLAPWWGYDKLGFEVSGETNDAVSASPIPAISSGYKGVGGPVTVPNLVRLLPSANAIDVAPDEPLRVRFDQPMDRTSVENVLRIDPPASGVFSWDADNELRFSPTSPGLLRGVTYQVVLSGTARSIAGTPLDRPVAWSFRTRELPSVEPDLPLDFAAISPDASLALDFSVPMDASGTARHISLRAADSQEEIPVSLSWDMEGQKLAVLPAKALPEGRVWLTIGALARTRSGETLGRPYQFTYNVGLPAPRLRFVEGRLALAALQSPIKVKYEALGATPSRPDAGDTALSDIALKVYALPADRFSALGAEASSWPQPLPAGVVDSLSMPDAAQVYLDPEGGVYGTADISGLRAGTYLLAISAPGKAGLLSDWQVLVVADSNLTLLESGGPFWATGPDAHAWQNAEVSLYSPAGALVEKGLTGATGLWYPSSMGVQASLAIAQDSAGHVAAFRCHDDGADCGGQVSRGDSHITLQTDRSSYLPGQSVNFQVLLGSTEEISQGTPVAEQDISVSLLMPGGATLALLKLKPDDTGGTSGLFNLSPGLLPGGYTLRASAGTATRDFPLEIESPPQDTLSVYVVPEPGLQLEQSSTLTRTISILGEGGAPASGAAITATLRIQGDDWVSQAVKSTADAQGRAQVVLSLPSWTANYTEPGLYLNVEASSGGLQGSTTSYLDMASPSRVLGGVRQLVSPGLGIVVIAPPAEEGNIRLRVVSLQGPEVGSDVLVLAQSPSGEQASWSLDQGAAAGGDVTLPIPVRFAGGRVLVQRANTGSTRELRLPPAQNPNIALQITAANTALPGAQLPTTLDLRDKDGQQLEGSASLQFRPVSGASSPTGASDWEPNVNISAHGGGPVTLSAPIMPGLWQIIARASLPDGSQTWAWSMLRVLPGPVVQVPPSLSATADEAQTVSVLVHNPTDRPLLTSVRAVGDPGVVVLGSASQALDLRAGAWGRLTWRILPTQAGSSTVTFNFVPSSDIEGSSSLHVQSADNPRTKTTYISGSASGERTVGVQVPSGLSDDAVKLEIHASTSLLTTIEGIAAAIPSGGGGIEAATRLSSGASVASAYNMLGASTPSWLPSSAVERSLLMQQIYTTQHSDGGWGPKEENIAEASSVDATSYVLLSMRRYSLALTGAGGDVSLPDIDSTLLNRGLAYLSLEAGKPLPAESAQALLDQRARALYVLSIYGLLDAEIARPLIAQIKGKSGEGLSVDGQAWLAIALLQAGAPEDALALIDRLVLETRGQARASAPLLEALIAASQVDRKGRFGPLTSSDYATATEATALALMDSREGVGWRTHMATGDALWALSRYAAESEEKPVRSSPNISLNDHPVQVPSQLDDPGAVSIAISGDALHAGTNWLKLIAPSGRIIYYSLTLSATR